jgi:hypothetical protein
MKASCIREPAKSGTADLERSLWRPEHLVAGGYPGMSTRVVRVETSDRPIAEARLFEVPRANGGPSMVAPQTNVVRIESSSPSVASQCPMGAAMSNGQSADAQPDCRAQFSPPKGTSESSEPSNAWLPSVMRCPRQRCHRADPLSARLTAALLSSTLPTSQGYLP